MSLIKLVFSNGNEIEEREVIHNPITGKDNEFIFYNKKYRKSDLDGHYWVQSSYSHTTLYVDFI